MVTWFGADWDSKKCVVAFEDSGKLRQKNVRRHPDAVREFLEAHGGGVAVVGIESGDRMWAELWRRAGASVYVFDGKKARRFSESFCSSGARDDKRAAEHLLAMVRSEAHRQNANSDTPAEVRHLKRLLRLTDETARDIVRAENRLAACLNQVMPAILSVAPRSLRTAWGLRLFTLAPTPRHWRALSANERERALKGSGKAKRAALRRAMAEMWADFDDDEYEAIAVQVQSLVQSLRDALTRDKTARQALRAAVAKRPEAATLTLIKGIGDSLAAALIIGVAGHGDRNRLAFALGAAPVTTRSGQRGDAQPAVRMRRAAAASMRRASYQLGWQLTGNHPWARAQYAAYRHKGHSAAAAYRRITRSFARVVPALLREGIPFDEERYIRTLKDKGVSWAKDL